jgi:Zn-dependent M28 family amino/carboxypeptidase
LAVAPRLIGRGVAGIVLVNLPPGEFPNQPFSLIADYLSRRQVESAAEPDPLANLPIRLPPIMLVSDEGAEKTVRRHRRHVSGGACRGRKRDRQVARAGQNAYSQRRLRREQVNGSNVVGLLPGADPKRRREAVIYTAHYDAFGKDMQGRIFPGAADNALGVAEMIAIAEALAKAPPAQRPRRSVVFLAVTGEEHGLLGAEHWLAHPTWPLPRIAANLNFDGIGTEVWGPLARVVGYGAEHSSLGRIFEGVTRATSREVWPDPMPEEKVFVRSDHYAFVKRGVPALMLLGAPAGDKAALLARFKAWEATDYHQTGDVVRPDWNWGGARSLAVIGLILGHRVANAPALPSWNPTSPYNRPRGSVHEDDDEEEEEDEDEAKPANTAGNAAAAAVAR